MSNCRQHLSVLCIRIGCGLVHHFHKAFCFLVMCFHKNLLELHQGLGKCGQWPSNYCWCTVHTFLLFPPSIRFPNCPFPECIALIHTYLDDRGSPYHCSSTLYTGLPGFGAKAVRGVSACCWVRRSRVLPLPVFLPVCITFALNELLGGPSAGVSQRFVHFQALNYLKI